MKKVLVFSLAFVLIISALLLVGCSKEPEKEPVVECTHSYKKTVTPPTCTAAGEEKFSCTKCGYYYTIEIEPTAHTGGTPVEENRIDPIFCIAGKYDSVVYCTVCDAEVSRETVTVTATGVHNVQNGVCTVCGGRESTPGLKYSQNADGTYTVTGIGTCTETDIVIGIYNNRDVTSIGSNAFRDCTSLTSIELPDSLTTIGEGAFRGCISLTSIVIPKGVTAIGYGAFLQCTSLTSIAIPEGVTAIGNYAFTYCTSLTSITVAEGNENFKSIDENLYSKDGKTLIQYAIAKTDTAFTVPEGVTTIGDGAFYKCTSLTSIVIPEGVTTIGHEAFNGCISLTSIVIPEGVTAIGNYAFTYCTSLTSIVVPKGVTAIGNNAFIYCTSLTSIVIPEGVTTIGDWAFNHCTSLTSIELPDSLTTIGSDAFYYCTSLTNITVSEGNGNYKSVDGNLYSKDGKTLIQYAIGKTDTAFTVPEGVTTIGEDAFSGCTSLKSIELPDSLTTIGNGAFSTCSSLTSIVIPEGVTTIGYAAFYNCTSLTIYCEVAKKPSGWSNDWNSTRCPVVWGYKGE